MPADFQRMLGLNDFFFGNGRLFFFFRFFGRFFWRWLWRLLSNTQIHSQEKKHSGNQKEHRQLHYRQKAPPTPSQKAKIGSGGSDSGAAASSKRPRPQRRPPSADLFFA